MWSLRFPPNPITAILVCPFFKANFTVFSKSLCSCSFICVTLVPRFLKYDRVEVELESRSPTMKSGMILYRNNVSDEPSAAININLSPEEF